MKLPKHIRNQDVDRSPTMSLHDLLYEITIAGTMPLTEGKKRADDAIRRYFVEKGEYRIAQEWAKLCGAK